MDFGQLWVTHPFYNSYQQLHTYSNAISKCYSPPVFQLRYLQTLGSIAAENNSTIVFPVPIDILSNMFQGNKQGGLEQMMEQKKNNSQNE